MIAGVDEAGRGPVLGPLVICALSSRDPEWLFGLSVKDSKITSPERRSELHDILTERCSYCLVSIPAGAIDAARENMTMNRLEVLGFTSALASLVEKRSVRHPDLPDAVIIKVHDKGGRIESVYLDAADVDAGRFGTNIRSELDRMGIRIPDIISEHKADARYPVVSAASIIAKVSRDRSIEEISESVSTDIGSGYPADPVTRAFLESWVRKNGDLPEFARRSWDTSRNILRDMGQSRLSDFG
ncbi:MAG: ribonuclease HII [Thermoplasmatota archaeon]